MSVLVCVGVVRVVAMVIDVGVLGEEQGDGEEEDEVNAEEHTSHQKIKSE